MKIVTAEIQIKGLLIVLFVGLIIRVFYLQISSQEQLNKISNENIVRDVPIFQMRGDFYDREGRILVANQPLYIVTVIPFEFNQDRLPLLSWALDVDEAILRSAIQKGYKYNKFLPTSVMRDIDFQTFARVTELLWKLPGVKIEVQSKRNYFNVSPVHAFGYTNIISKEMLNRQAEDGYDQNDIVGHSGIEYTYEKHIRGKKGRRLIVVNSFGKYISDFEEGSQNVEPQHGEDLILSIDLDLQKKAEDLLDSLDVSGSIIMMSPKTGEVFSIASSPGYDPNILSDMGNKKKWYALVQDRKKPLFDRSIQALYPPGSTYKMVSAIAGLEERKITPAWTSFCRGSYRYGNRVFKCHKQSGHGHVNLEKALQLSCNVFFYKLMFRIGFENWTKYGKMMGFGDRTGIDIPQEKTAILPSREHFDHIYGRKKWTTGYLVSLSIGQGELITTPIQVLKYISIIASQGIVPRPHLVKARRKKDDHHQIPFPVETKKINISPETWSVVRTGLLKCVEAGTGRAARVPNIKVSGKTGTAQNPHGKDHAWFTGYAPFDNPEVAIVVFLENIGGGGRYAAPLAGKLLRAYFDKQRG